MARVWREGCMECGPVREHAAVDGASPIGRKDALAAKINPIDLPKHLKGVGYPASKRDVLAKARENGTDQEPQSMLERLCDERFGTPADVKKAIGDVNDSWSVTDDVPCVAVVPGDAGETGDAAAVLPPMQLLG